MTRVDHSVVFHGVVKAAAKGVNKIDTPTVRSSPMLQYDIVDPCAAHVDPISGSRRSLDDSLRLFCLRGSLGSSRQVGILVFESDDMQ